MVRAGSKRQVVGSDYIRLYAPAQIPLLDRRGVPSTWRTGRGGGYKIEEIIGQTTSP